MKIKTNLIVFISLVLSNNLFSQAIINDKDGFVNVRLEADKGSKLIDTLRNGHLIFPLERDGNWVSIDYFKKNESFSGFIYSDRIKKIEQYPEIKRKKSPNNEIILKNDSIEISVTEKKFEPKEHKFSYSKENAKSIIRIDKKEYYGTDGEMPKTQYHEIKVKIKNQVISLPKSATENLYEPSLEKIVANYDKENDIIYINSYNSDGAGGYIVVWKIKKGKYEDRLVFYGF